MGFFGGDYDVVKLGMFGFDETVLERVDLDEAQRFIDHNSGVFGSSSYKIVKRW